MSSDQIRRGVLPLGEALPTEHSLGPQLGVSRITVRRALAELESAGYVERRQGRGTFVRSTGGSGIVPEPLTLSDALQKAERETIVRVVEVALRRPPAAIAAALQLPPDAESLYACASAATRTAR